MSSARDRAARLLLHLEKVGGRLRAMLDAEHGELEDQRERGLLTELAYGVQRRRGTLDAVLARSSRRPLANLNAAVRTALRLGLYQVLFLDRTPAHAAVDHAVGWARRRAGPKRAGFVNGVLRNVLRDLEGKALGPEDPTRDVPREDGSALRFRRTVFADPDEDVAGNLAARYACPRWLVERWLQNGDEAACAKALRAGITRPPLTLRARGPRADLAAQLKELKLPFEAGPVDSALLLSSFGADVRGLVEAGAAAVQDATQQRVAPLLQPQPGQRILDLCAAPGGKTLHLADLMGAGEVVACDVDDAKVRHLEDLTSMTGDVAVRAHRVEGDGALPFEPATFDGVLVDAPCSNTGVLRRRVELRWRLTAERITALADLQVALLERALPLLADGGRLVYSTCSLEPEENEGVLERVLAAHTDVQGTVAFRVGPGREADGGFAAVFTRT